jgi:protein-S-isoprenylcysteine O-methyltransferase Ste14
MPRTSAEITMYLLWIVWLLYWIARARNVKRTKWRESLASRAVHECLFVICAILLAWPDRLPTLLTRRIIWKTTMVEISGAIVVATGLSLTVWARRCLGGNWSGTVTLKEDHTLIRNGPYRLVRHPIYSGLLLALCGTALVVGELRGVFAFASAFFAFLWKIRVEEERMGSIFAEHHHYRAVTWVMIPYIL